MQFAFTEDQNLIRETAREFLTERAGLAQLRRDFARPEGHDPALWQAITRELGWAGIALPESAGGSGLGMVELAILLEEQGRCLYGGPFLASAGFASALLLEAPASDARDAILARLTSGEAIAAAAFTGESGLAGRDAVQVELVDGEHGPVLVGLSSIV